jgi:CDP-diacylglycerol---serine O-phosphatidyltransferase
LANIFSILSLSCGFASIIFSLESRFTFASWAILLSAIFDGLDGQIARRGVFGSTEFGKQLDSLVDVVAFGISPLVLGYIFVCQRFYLLAALSLFIYLACSVVRLAKYNITLKEKLADYFWGLPTTVSGGMLASLILIYRRYTKLPILFIFLLLVLLLAFLMVSKVRYPNLDGLKLILGRGLLPFLITLLIVFIFIPEITIFSLFLIYLIFSPFMVKRIA